MTSMLMVKQAPEDQLDPNSDPSPLTKTQHGSRNASRPQNRCTDADMHQSLMSTGVILLIVPWVLMYF